MTVSKVRQWDEIDSVYVEATKASAQDIEEKLRVDLHGKLKQLHDNMGSVNIQDLDHLVFSHPRGGLQTVVEKVRVKRYIQPGGDRFVVRFDQTPPYTQNGMPLLQIKVDDEDAFLADQGIAATLHCERCERAQDGIFILRKDCELSADEIPKCPAGEWLARLQWVGILEDESNILHPHNITKGEIEKDLVPLERSEELPFYHPPWPVGLDGRIKFGRWTSQIHWDGYKTRFGNDEISREDVFARMRCQHLDNLDKFQSGVHDDMFSSDVQLRVPGFEWNWNLDLTPALETRLNSLSGELDCVAAAAYILKTRLSYI